MGAMIEAVHDRDIDLRLWAAEEVAVQLGWLNECPYHGQPFKARNPQRGLRTSASAVHPSDSALRLFSSAEELLSVARQVARTYGKSCSICARERFSD